MTRNILLPILSLLFLISFFGNAQNTAAITGTIVAADTNEPIPSANIKMNGTDKGTITDEQGNFKLERVANGIYSLTVTYLGFEPFLVENI